MHGFNFYRITSMHASCVQIWYIFLLIIRTPFHDWRRFRWSYVSWPTHGPTDFIHKIIHIKLTEWIRRFRLKLFVPYWFDLVVLFHLPWFQFEHFSFLCFSVSRCILFSFPLSWTHVKTEVIPKIKGRIKTSWYPRESAFRHVFQGEENPYR